MYNKKLRKREQTLIQSPPEPVIKKWQTGKYSYLAVLIILIFVGGKTLFEKIAFSKGIGFLEAEAIFIEASVPGRIVDINFTINDTIVPNVPVVALDKSLPFISSNGNHNNYYSNERRIINTQKEISILRTELTASKDKLKQLEKEHHKAEDLYFANAIVQSEFFEIKSKLNEARSRISKLHIELDAARKQLNSYRNQHNILNGSVGATNIQQLYSSRDGVIAKIFKNKGEVVKMGEPIVKLINPESETVRTYFVAGTENKISKGDPASIYFQNGDRVEGVVSKIYASTAEQPPEIRHKFGKVQRFIIAEIIPNQPLRTRVFETQVDVFIAQKWLRSLKNLI